MPNSVKNPFAVCPKCFQRKRLKAICSRCSFQENPLPARLYLPYRTHLDGRFRTGIILGKSAISVIYLAYDDAKSELLVLKEYFPRQLAERSDSGYISSRKSEFMKGMLAFREEFAILQNLEHPNIVRPREVIETNGTIYISMDFCGYENLERHASSYIAQSEILKLMTPVFDALETVHASNLLHCDVNPENIQLSSDESEKKPILLDFGSARFQNQNQSRESHRPLTFNPGYSAPEQHTGSLDQYRPWTDVYACAATIYRLSTGTKPTPAPARRIKDTLKSPISRNSKLNQEFSDAVMRGLALDPYERPASIQEFKSLFYGGTPDTTAPHLSQTSVHAEKIKDSISTVLAPFLILAAIVSILWFLFGSEATHLDAREVACRPFFKVSPADYYILRDVSLSIDQARLDYIENIIRESIRTEDEGEVTADFTRYAYFASWVTDGSPQADSSHTPPRSLQAAARGDNINDLKNRLRPNDLPRVFRGRTDYKEVFDQTFDALGRPNGRTPGSTLGREVFVALLTDGLPDQEGNLSPCLDTAKVDKEDFSILDGPTLRSFNALARSGAYILIVLAGGDRDCAGTIEKAWKRVQKGIPLPYRDRITILPLNGYDERGERRELTKFLGTIKRTSVVVARPATGRLSDGQREEFDRGKPFYADFFFQSHLCDRVRINIRAAEILSLEKIPIAKLDVVDRKIFDVAAMGMGSPRNGELESERIYFQILQVADGFRPNEEEAYQLRIDAEASSPGNAGTKVDIPVVVESDLLVRESISTEMKIARIARLEDLALVLALVGIVFSTALVSYWRLGRREQFKTTRRWLRSIFVRPLRYWLMGFFAISAILFVVSARLMSLSFMLWLVPASFLCFKSRDLIKKTNQVELSGSDILLSCFDSVLVPLAALLELLS